MFRLVPFSSSPFVILNPVNVSMLHILLEHIWGNYTRQANIFRSIQFRVEQSARGAWKFRYKTYSVCKYAKRNYCTPANRPLISVCAHRGNPDAGNQEKRRKLGFQLNWKLDPGNREKRDAKRKCLPLWGKTQYPSPAYVKPSVQKFTRFVLLRTRVSWILNF